MQNLRPTGERFDSVMGSVWKGIASGATLRRMGCAFAKVTGCMIMKTASVALTVFLLITPASAAQVRMRR